MAEAPKPGDSGAWGKRAQKIIREKRPLTEVSGSTKRSFYQVFEYKPDKDKDEKYILSGAAPMIALQASLLGAFNEMLINRLGASEADFDKWVKDFESGFNLFESASHKSDGQKSNRENKPYGLPREQRPRVISLEKNGAKPSYRVVEFWPNRDDPTETYLFSGTSAEIIEKIEKHWNFLRALRNYDIGEYLGYNINDWLRQSPKRLTLNIMMSIHQSPPFNRKVNIGGKLTEIGLRQVSIPYPKRAALSYSALRNVCGGNGGLGWGHHTARAYITPDPAIQNKRGAAQMVASGSTPAEANANLDRFLGLTEGFVIDRSEGLAGKITKQKDAKGQYLKNYRIFPAHVFIENAKLIDYNESQQGRVVQGGRKVSNKSSLDIWMENEPTGFAERMRELLKSPTNPQIPSP